MSWGRRDRLGRSGGKFESFIPDVADKFQVGDEVRVTQNIEFGDVKVKKTTKGVIKSISIKVFGKTQYGVQWRGTNFVMTMNGSGSFVQSQVTETSGVFKE